MYVLDFMSKCWSQSWWIDHVLPSKAASRLSCVTLTRTMQAFGVFLAYYYAHDVFPGTTSFEFAFIGGLSISQALLVSPLITVSTRRWGVRTTLFIGVALLSIGLLGASFATQFWQLLLAQGGCFGWGMGFLYIGSVGIIPQWFDRRRSLAMGIATSGAGFGGLGFNLLTNALIERVGLASTLRTLATCSFVVSSICALVLRDRNKLVRPKQVAFDFRLFRRPEVLLIVGWGWMSELGYIVLYYSLPNYAASIGLSPRQGALAGALLNLGLAIGRPIIGYYSDQIGCINMAMLMTGFCGVLCLLVWIFARTYGVLLFFAIMAGTVCGTFWSTIAPVGTAIFGLKELPSALSMTWILLVLPCTCKLHFRRCQASKRLTSVQSPNQSLSR